MFYSAPNQLSSLIWYPELSATNHLTSDLNNLNIQTKEYTGQDQIHVGNRLDLNTSHVGSFSILTPSTFVLKNVLHVPQIQRIYYLWVNYFFFEFHSKHFVAKDQSSGTPLLQGPSEHSVDFGKRTSFDDWHRQLGHPTLCTIQRTVALHHLPTVSNKAYVVCFASQHAKSCQLPFKSSSFRSRVLWT